MTVISDCGFGANGVPVIVRLEDETIGNVHADDVPGFKQSSSNSYQPYEAYERASQRSEFVIGYVRPS